MRRENNPLMSGNSFKILSILILAPGNNAELRFFGNFNMKKTSIFGFFLEFGVIIEFRRVSLLRIIGGFAPA